MSYEVKIISSQNGAIWGSQASLVDGSGMKNDLNIYHFEDPSYQGKND